MKVLLIKAVDTLGTPGQVVDVAAGYARNYLLPQKLAILATKGTMKMSASLKKAADLKAQELANEATALAAKLKDITLLFTAAADENGQLFGGISEREIAAALIEKKFDIDKKQIVLDAHIKNVGEHSVKIKIHGDIHENIAIKVDAEAK